MALSDLKADEFQSNRNQKNERNINEYKILEKSP